MGEGSGPAHRSLDLPRTGLPCLGYRHRGPGEGSLRRPSEAPNAPGGHRRERALRPERRFPRVVYHGLSDWLRWQRKEKEVRSVLSYREVYEGNPWKDQKAWSRTEVQFVVRK